MPIRSRALGVAGIADVVELTREGGRWPCPIEYKRGRPKAPIVGAVWSALRPGAHLEEMFATAVPEGALFMASAPAPRGRVR